jgi:hypothetical protein
MGNIPFAEEEGPVHDDCQEYRPSNPAMEPIQPLIGYAGKYTNYVDFAGQDIDQGQLCD